MTEQHADTTPPADDQPPADDAAGTAGQTAAGDPDDDQPPADPDDDDAETFPRSYVERLRRENQRYRDQAGHADDYAHRLHTEIVRATGRLADPTDVEFDAEHLADADQLDAAITALLDAKPHLAARRPAGDIGQGNRGTPGAFSLLDTLRSRV